MPHGAPGPVRLSGKKVNLHHVASYRLSFGWRIETKKKDEIVAKDEIFVKLSTFALHQRELCENPQDSLKVPSQEVVCWCHSTQATEISKNESCSDVPVASVSWFCVLPTV